VRTVQTGPVIGLIVDLVVLAALTEIIGLSAVGWIVGVSCGVVTNLALQRGLARVGAAELGPANRVTLARAGLVAGVAALSANTLGRPASVPALVAISSLALALDALDGWVARRTETASTLGARFDMEVDAFLILVLSVYVARTIGWWVLAIGAARYAFVAAGWLAPWLRVSLPPRYWRKVVAATQGIVLTLAASTILPRPWVEAALVASLALLAESFGRDVWWLWRRRMVRHNRTVTAVRPPAPAYALLVNQMGVRNRVRRGHIP
jgi:phosphatidylglycerophosphate synthase